MNLLILSAISYLIGAIPFAYVIGKLFFNTDIRQKGSGNLGGSNAGRVLGYKSGLSVMVLDLLKVTLAVSIAGKVSTHPWATGCAAISAAIGHCYPIYVRFRGGKAVAALYGFLFALWIAVGWNPCIFFLPLVTFLLILYVFRIVSLASILSFFCAIVYVWILSGDIPCTCCTAAFFILIVRRHRENIQRIRSGTERKISWMPKRPGA